MRAWASSSLPQRHQEVLSLLQALDMRTNQDPTKQQQQQQQQQQEEEEEGVGSSFHRTEGNGAEEGNSKDGEDFGFDDNDDGGGCEWLEVAGNGYWNSEGEDNKGGGGIPLMRNSSGGSNGGGGRRRVSLSSTHRVDGHCFQLGLEACAATADPRRALLLIDRMHARGPPPNLVHFNIALKALAKAASLDDSDAQEKQRLAGDEDDDEESWRGNSNNNDDNNDDDKGDESSFSSATRRRRRRRRYATPAGADGVKATAVDLSYCRDALGLVHEMEQLHSVKPDAFTLNTALDVLAKRGLWKHALELFHDGFAHSQPEIFTHGDGGGDGDEGKGGGEEEIQGSRRRGKRRQQQPLPDRATFTTLLMALARGGGGQWGGGGDRGVSGEDRGQDFFDGMDQGTQRLMSQLAAPSSSSSSSSTPSTTPKSQRSSGGVVLLSVPLELLRRSVATLSKSGQGGGGSGEEVVGLDRKLAAAVMFALANSPAPVSVVAPPTTATAPEKEAEAEALRSSSSSSSRHVTWSARHGKLDALCFLRLLLCREEEEEEEEESSGSGEGVGRDTRAELLQCLPPVDTSPRIASIARTLDKQLPARVSSPPQSSPPQSSSSTLGSLMLWNCAADAAASLGDAATCLAILSHLEARSSESESETQAESGKATAEPKANRVQALAKLPAPDAFTFGRAVTACCTKALSSPPASSSSPAAYCEAHQLLVAATDVMCRMLDRGGVVFYEGHRHEEEEEGGRGDGDGGNFHNGGNSPYSVEESLSEIRWVVKRRRAELGEPKAKELLHALATIQAEYDKATNFLA